SGEPSPIGVGGVDGLFGLGAGVRWRRGLTAEGGGDEQGERLEWSHVGSPLGEDEENTGAAERWQAAADSFAPGGKQVLRACGAQDDSAPSLGRQNGV